jgi:hypothetical protein
MGPSRLLLTRLIREGSIWEVYVATRAQSGADNLTQLEFETPGPQHRRTRYARPVEGALLEALHTGAPVSRSSLEEQLDLAMREAAADVGAAADDAAAAADADAADYADATDHADAADNAADGAAAADEPDAADDADAAEDQV